MLTSSRRARAALSRGLCCLATLLPVVVAAADGAPAAGEPAVLAPQPDAAAAIDRTYTGTPIDVTTYHYDGLRTGWNPRETDLTQASVKSAKFGLLKTIAVDGIVLAQPLLVSGFAMPDGTRHDVLLVVTGHNSVYAIDANSGAQLWKVNLGPSQSSNDVGCQQVAPEYGILATPVIVRDGAGRAAVYVVSATEPSSMEFHTRLHVLDLRDGSSLKAAVEISPSTTSSDGSTLRFDPKNQWVRAGLAWGSDSLYVTLSSHCDNNAGAISGWVLRYGPRLDLMKAFNTIETPAGYKLAAIWMSGFAPALDPDGNLYAITGNGNFSKGGKDWGESVIRLPSTLAKVQDYFTPAAYRSLNDTDADFGSGGVMLLPRVTGQAAPSMAVAMGKDATLYLLDRDKLGKVQAGDAGALQATDLGTQGVWGGPAYFQSPTGPVVFYQPGNTTLRAYAVATGAAPALTQRAQGTSIAGFGGSIPVVSSNGSAAGTGVVWVVRRGETLTLEAYDAERLGAPLFSAPAGSWVAGRGNAYVTALQANGRVWVPGYKMVTMFGLAP